MANYDGSIRFHTDVENKELIETEKAFERIEKKATRAAEAMKKVPPKKKLQEGSWKGLSYDVEEYQTRLKSLRDKGFGFGDELYDQLYIAWKNAADAEKKYVKSLDLKTEKGIAEEKARQAKEQEKIAQAAEKERAKKKKEEAQLKTQIEEERRLHKIRESAVVSDQRVVNLTNEKLNLESRLADLKKAGVTQGYKEYDEISARLGFVNKKLAEIERNGFSKATKSAKKLFGVINTDSKKSNTALSNTSKMISKMMLRMVALKAITGTISYVKDGVDNLVQYSTELNGALSELKSSSAQLKNSLATAFAPILTMAIPYITKLIGWLTTAANAISQFWAVLGGKNTYTKAKKQVVDYAKSLGTATKAAKGALAAFDEINVLEKNDDSGGAGGGEVTGADAFEEVAVDEGFAAAVEKVKAVLEAILPLVILIGAAFLAWKIYDLLSSLMLAHPILGKIAACVILIIGLVLAVYNYFKMWTEGVDWEGIIGYVAGVTMVVMALYMLFGPLVAGIALIIAAIAGVVLAIKDMLENGVTAENMGLLIISIVGLLIGVFLVFGATVAVVVGAVVAVVAVLAMLVAYGGNGAEALEHLKNTFKSLGEFLKKVFAGDFKGALEDLKAAGRSFGNFFISVAEGVANGFIKMVNAIIDAINSIDVTIPDWVPIFGGKQFSPNIPHWNAHVSLPRLATGGIATSSTIANIGEAGREAVLPLENHTEWMDTLAERINSGREIRIVFTGDLAELGRVLKPVIDAENARIGASLLMG